MPDQDAVRPEPFWNMSAGVRVPEPIPGLYAGICASTHHVYDDYYGPLTCARCGHDDRPPKRSLWSRVIASVS